MHGELEIRLEVPNLGEAASFYTALFDALPAATERQTVWVDIPDSRLRIELREALTPTTTRLRLCTEPRQLELVTGRLRRDGMVIAQAGLTTGGNPRSISFRDPGDNSWELYTPISVSRPPRRIREITSGLRYLSQLARAAVPRRRPSRNALTASDSITTRVGNLTIIEPRSPDEASLGRCTNVLTVLPPRTEPEATRHTRPDSACDRRQPQP